MSVSGTIKTNLKEMSKAQPDAGSVIGVSITGILSCPGNAH